jgi:hypothetical protein
MSWHSGSWVVGAWEAAAWDCPVAGAGTTPTGGGGYAAEHAAALKDLRDAGR